MPHLELLSDWKILVIARYEAIQKQDTLDCFVPCNDGQRLFASIMMTTVVMS